MPNGRSSAQERVADSARPTRQLTNAPSFTTTFYSASNYTREGVLIAEFTDDEEENDQSYDPSEIRSIARNVGEDVVRTGEASRLRRRGAVHGRRPQLPYVTLVCGAPLPWQFKFNQPDEIKPMRPSSLRSLMQRYESLKGRPSSSSSASQDLSLEFPSTGCRAVLTNRAYVSPTHHVYSAQIATGSVRQVDRSYLDMEQRSTLVDVLRNYWGQLEWQGQGLACSNCGNIIGFRYAPAVFYEQGKLVLNGTDPAGYTPKERFAFFASAVTSSKPYDFATQQHYSYPYHWRYLEPLTTTPIVSSDSRSSLGPRTSNHLDTTVLNSQGIRPYRHHHDPSAVSQDRHNSISFPIASSDEVGLQSQQEYPLPSWSFRSLSPLSSDELLPPEDELGPNNFELWVAWPSNPAPNDENRTMSEHSTAEAVSVQHPMQTQDDGVHDQRGQLSPWQQPMAIDLQPTDLSDSVIQPHESDGEVVFESEAIDTSSDMLQDQHASNVPPVGYEHEPFGSTINAVTEVQASDDHHADNTWADSPSMPSQQQPLHLPDVEISNPFPADDSQAQGSERVHGSMAQPESDAIGVLRQEAVIDSAFELDATVQGSNTLESFSVVPSTIMLPNPLPIAYESPATVVDVEASNEMTGEVENVGILIEVASPPSDATSSFGSAVVVPSLVPSSTDSSLPGEGLQPSPATSVDQSSQLAGPLERLSYSAGMEVSHIFSNNPLDTTQGPDTIATATEDPDSNGQEPLSSSSYHHYTPPLPQLSAQDLASSLPTTPHTSFTLVPLLSPGSASLLTFLESDEGGLISAEPDASSESLDMDTEGASPSQPLDRIIEVSVPRDENTETWQPYFEQDSSEELGQSSYPSENVRSAAEEHTDITLVSRSQSPSPSPSSSRRAITAAPVSNPQPLPANSPILHEAVSTGASSVSRRFPRHAFTRSSSSQDRSSSRRSWRTPRELDDSPVSLNDDGDDDVDNSVSRLRFRSGRETGSVLRNESRPVRGTQPSPSMPRRTRGYSRTRRRLSSSSRRDSRMSSASGPTHHTISSDLIRSSNQLRTGADILYRHSNLTALSPELIRRGSLPNIQRPRLGGLIRRDSLPVLPVQRQPLSDLTATFRQQNQFTPPPRFPDSAASPRLSPEMTEDHSPVLNQRYLGERLVLEVDGLRGNGQDADTRHSPENDSEQENEPVIDPEDALTPRPRRHTTMPVFIPSPPSDSESELEDNTQPNDRVSFSRGPSLVPWMPWEWCWQDRQQVPLENRLQIEVHTTQITGESDDKED